MKKIISVLLTLLMALSITACGSKVSDDLKDLNFSLDNKSYKLPCDYSTLVKDGWTLEHPEIENSKLKAKSYTREDMIKDGNEVSVDFINSSDDEKPLSECQIGGIWVQSNKISDPSYFKIAKGITVNSSREDVVNAFFGGVDEGGSPLIYTVDEENYYASVWFHCEKEEYDYIYLKSYRSGF